MTEVSQQQTAEQRFINQQQESESLAHYALQQAEKHGVDGCEVAFSVDAGFSVTVRQGEVESVEHQWEKNGTLTIYHQQHCASTSSSVLTTQSMEQLWDKALKIAHYTDADSHAGLPDQSKQAYDYADLDLFHPWTITPETAIQSALACERQALQQDKRLSSEGVVVETHKRFQLYANSNGFVGDYFDTEHALICSLLATQGEDRQRDMDYTVARHPSGLEDASKVANRAVELTTSRLNARRLTTQSCSVLFAPQVARTLVGHLISAISGGRLYKQASFLLDQLGERLFPDWVNIVERPDIKGALGSRPFDSEGVQTSTKALIDQGCLANYLFGSYSARRMNTESTGNAGGISNVIVESSGGDWQQLLKQMGTGLVVTELLGQGVNLVTGDYSRGAFGYWVENGQIQYPVHEITVAGNLADMFSQLAAIGSDVDKRSAIHTGSWLIESMQIAGE